MDLTDTPTPGYGIELPGGWYAYDPDPESRPGSITAQVDARIGLEPHLAAVRPQLIEILTDFARGADEAGARLGATWWEPGVPGAVVAQVMVLDGVRVVTDSVDGEIADLLDRLTNPLDSDIGVRRVTAVELPAGPAVRLQLLSETGAGATDGCTYGVDVIQFWIPASQYRTNVVVVGETPCLDLDVDFPEVIDTIAATLRID